MPLSPNQTRELLQQLEHSPNKKLGQNFLIDGNLVRKSIELADLDANSKVIEIGPGLGTLSAAVLQTGSELYAVEQDARLVQHLRTHLCPAHPRFHLTEGDCLDFPLANCSASEESTKIVANLPYAVSTPWMDSVLAGPLPRRMVLMLQKEAADRYVARHGSKVFGAISIFLQSAYREHTRHKVSASCFHPAPKIESVLLRLDLREHPIRFDPPVRECIRRIFTQRRKQLGALCKREPFTPAEKWFEYLVAKGISPTARPEEIPVEEWVHLGQV